MRYEGSSPPKVFLYKKYSENKQQTYRRLPTWKCDFNKKANNVLSYQLFTFSQNTFPWKYLSGTASNFGVSTRALLIRMNIFLLHLTELKDHCFLPEPFLLQLSFIKYFFHELLWIVHLNLAHYLLDLDFRTVRTELQKYCCMHLVKTAVMGSAHRKFSPDMPCFPDRCFGLSYKQAD